MDDRISNLSDDLLRHILSFLPTDDAFATSLVSKRWRPLWLSVPTFDFVEHRYTRHGNTRFLRSYSSFIEFVDASILRRGIHQPIKTFYLECSLCPVFQVEKWLKTAADGEVENLQFNCYSGQVLPCYIFSITTLVVLKLQGATFCDFSSVELPSLKTLHLSFVRFSKSQHFIDLLNGCPTLEIFEAELITFDFVDDPSGRKLTTLSKLVRADVSHMLTDFHLPVRIFYNVEWLRIEECYDYDINIPIFPNLIHLKLIFGPNVKWESVLDMLNRCPQLQSFVLENLYPAYKIWPNTHVVPECFSSQLTECSLEKFSAKESEMRFAKFVMQNSALLHTMTISSHSYLSHEKMLEMRKELYSCPRSSASCELLFM